VDENSWPVSPWGWSPGRGPTTGRSPPWPGGPGASPPPTHTSLRDRPPEHLGAVPGSPPACVPLPGPDRGPTARGRSPAGCAHGHARAGTPGDEVLRTVVPRRRPNGDPGGIRISRRRAGAAGQSKVRGAVKQPTLERGGIPLDARTRSLPRTGRCASRSLSRSPGARRSVGSALPQRRCPSGSSCTEPGRRRAGSSGG
jgi:hypothetical protein